MLIRVTIAGLIWSPVGTNCIGRNSIDRSLSEAKHRVGLLTDAPQPYTFLALSALGHAIDETLRDLVTLKCTIPNDDIHRMFATMDLNGTDIAGHCPTTLTNKKHYCIPKRYRSYDGTCNNLRNPLWGSTLTVYRPPAYDDGISSPRTFSASSHQLPAPREVSSAVHQGSNRRSQDVTTFFTFWGQALGHDLRLTPAYAPPDSAAPPLVCCNGSTQLPAHGCSFLNVTDGDPFFSRHKIACMSLIRSASGLRSHCRLGLKELMPASVHCSTCFLAGDSRANENPCLATIHTLFVREHNRVAGELALINAHWNDEKLFQETRRIHGALVQSITFNEYLNLLIGPKARRLLGKSADLFEGYDDNVDPTLFNQFVSAAFRFGHSTVPAQIERRDSTHRFVAAVNLRSTFFNPKLEIPGFVDQFLLGMANQPAQSSDSDVVNELTQHVFRTTEGLSARDLVSLDILVGWTIWYEDGRVLLLKTKLIQKIKLARVVCDNADRIGTMQLRVMELPNNRDNQRVACSSTKSLPRLDLSLWKD